MLRSRQRSDFAKSILEALSHAAEQPQHHQHRHVLVPGHTHNCTEHFGSYCEDGVRVLQPKSLKIHFTLTNLTRVNQAPPVSLQHGINHLVSDYSSTSLEEAFINQHVIISTVAASDVSFQKRLIDAAIAAGVPRFIPNEFAHDTLSSSICNRLPPYRARAEVLRYLQDRAKAVEGFSWTALATGCLFDKGLKDGLLGFDLTWLSATVYATGDERFPCSTLRDVGQVVGATLASEDDTAKNKYLYRASFMTNQSEILASLRRITDRCWTVGHVEVAECMGEGERRMKMGFFDGAMMLLERSVLFGDDMGNLSAWEQESSNMRSSKDREMLDAAVKGVLAELDRDGKPDCGCG